MQLLVLERQHHQFRISSRSFYGKSKALGRFIFYTKRQGNVPAHLLAQHTQNVENLVVWLEECPSQVAHACANDVTSSQIIE